MHQLLEQVMPHAADFSIFNCGKNGAAWFCVVVAIVEFALTQVR